MSDRNTEIGKGWGKARRAALFKELRRPKALWVFPAIILVIVVSITIPFIAATPPHLRETVLGYGLSEITTGSYWPTRRVTARLDSGRVVTFSFPKSELFLTDMPMKIAIYERSWGPIKYETKRFAGYADESR